MRVTRTLYYGPEYGLLEWNAAPQEYTSLETGDRFKRFPGVSDLVSVLRFYPDGEVAVEETARMLLPSGLPKEPELFWTDRDGDDWVKFRGKWVMLNREYGEHTWEVAYDKWGS